MSKRFKILVVKSVDDLKSVTLRFPVMLADVLVVVEDAQPQSVEGMRVDELFLTESVVFTETVDVLYRSLIFGAHGSTKMGFPLILKDNWREEPTSALVNKSLCIGVFGCEATEHYNGCPMTGVKRLTGDHLG